MRPLCMYVMGVLLGILPLIASGQNQILRDSVYFDVGIVGDTEFETVTRVYFEEYDVDGRALLIRSQKENSGGEWENWRQRAFTYTEDGLASVTISYWGPVVEDWQEAVERSFTYDSDGNRTSKLIRKASGAGMPLENKNQWTYEYDGQGNQTNSLYETWDGSGWEPVSRQVWSYNPQDRIEEQRLDLWDGSQWVNSRRRGWQYDNGAISQVLSQEWSEMTQEWENLERMEYLNDGNAFWTGQRKSGWNAITEEWDNQEQQLFEYNALFQLQNRTFQRWEDDAWQNIYQMYYEVGSGTVSVLGDRWDENDNDWFLHARHQAQTENYERLLQEQGWQFWNEDMEVWENDTLSFRRTHFWSEQNTATESVILPDHCVVPNPYTPGTAFSCEDLPTDAKCELQLVSLSGQLMYQSPVSGAGPHRISGNLPTGMYVLRITDGRQVFHLQKLVIAQ